MTKKIWQLSREKQHECLELDGPNEYQVLQGVEAGKFDAGRGATEMQVIWTRKTTGTESIEMQHK